MENKYERKEKRKKQKKNLVPTGFEPGRCGGRSWAPCHWAR
jgi:hypothetical protein